MLIEFGGVGVIVFFGISGFIMVHTQFQHFGSIKSSSDFLLRRLIRIVPLYAIATSLQYANKMNIGGAYNIGNYAKSLLFIPYLDDSGAFRPVLSQGWTLNYEMFFYLIFGLTLMLPAASGLLLSTCFFAALVLLNPLLGNDHTLAGFYTNQILLYFVCGMIAAVIRRIYLVEIRRASTTGWLVVLVMALLAAGRSVLPDLLYIPLSVVCVFLCVYLCSVLKYEKEGPFQKIFENLGNASYSTYLFHGFALGASKFLSNRIDGSSYFVVFAFICYAVVVANAAGFLVYSLVETPLVRQFNLRYRALRNAMSG